ncbi:MAG: phosphate ABC transporter ATP-binding protein [Oscillospiraceae bacterium]|nr:phosphate ABC transporter ATP-binding protein [Oscillospiraceae bacterium]
MEIIMKIDGLSAYYDGKIAVDSVSLEIPKNRISAIIGPSGCGKSTLLRCMNRMIEEEMDTKVEGSVYLEGKDIASIPKDELRRKIGMVFQSPAPFPFSIYKNMTYAPKYYGIRGKDRLNALVIEKLKMAGLYDEVKDELNKSALKLSGGQQQRLCIARTLSIEPDVLLLDEPCSALDLGSTAAIEKMLTDLKELYTIVIVTHNLAQAKRIGDYTAFLYNGKLIEWAPKDSFFSSPSKEETKAFLSGMYG